MRTVRHRTIKCRAMLTVSSYPVRNYTGPQGAELQYAFLLKAAKIEP
ncbi:MAG TPA: hypothetical protein VM487_21460 [Phycisphaerae bacterium]|nr:hypothetical protein [Phycisphaerae bacterium]